jgi:hypothetical protein
MRRFERRWRSSFLAMLQKPLSVALRMKHRIVHTLQKYLLNPPIKIALAMGLPLPGYALLETKGRTTGKPRRTPIGDGRIGNQFWLVAEHGTKRDTSATSNVIRMYV